VSDGDFLKTLDKLGEKRVGDFRDEEAQQPSAA